MAFGLDESLFVCRAINGLTGRQSWNLRDLIRRAAMVTVHIPTPLRRLTGGQSKVQASGMTVLDVIKDLEAKFPGFRDRLLDENGELKRFINIYVNEDEIRTLQGKETPVAEGDRISIVPAMAGG
jgi:molybdopterin synthase sulfur carrier subunit